MRTLLKPVFVFIFLLLAACAFSQTTGYSGTGGNIDVNYHRFVWTLNATTKSVSGTVTTYFTTKQSNVSQITFDFTKASFNNGSLVVKYHGSSAGVGVSFPTSGNVNILQITLPVTLPINKLDSVSITYAGTPPAFSTYGEGMDQGSIAGLGNALYTLAESYGDDDFWPCKADMQDKIDSVDFIITTPSTQMAAANGVLISNVTGGGNRTVTYKHRYPIASYLVAVAVAQYSVYNRTPVDINGTSVPIVYYIGSGRTPTTANFTTMDYCRDDLVAFSNVFGDYPFKNEKYGMYEFGWSGGMEHQTFSAMSWGSMTSWSVVAHELAHQWFGDKVTFGTWNHLWLAEGFARYCEALAAELVPAMGKNASTVRSNFKSTANNSTNRGTACFIPNASIANSNTIWNSNYGTTVYERGAMVVSMLRKLAGDTKFFQACRNYLNDPSLAYRSATTDDLKNHFETVLGYDLDAFFNDFVYGSGYPTYTVNWGNNGKRINIELTSQSRTSATTTYFRTPVTLTISNGAGKDTTVVIYDQNGIVSYAGNGILKTISGNRVGYNLSFVPTSVSFDLYNETLATGSASFNSALNNVTISVLDVKIVDFKGTEREDGNLLSLSIAPNSDKATFTLERSEDGNHFSAVGNMENGTNTPDGISYSFLDSKILKYLTYYYRVKAVDDKGEITYSKTVSMSGKNNEAGIRISPNPANNYLRISLPVSWQSKQIYYTIYSNNGMVIKNERITGSTNIEIALENISSGNYTIELINDNSKVSKKFAVIH